MGWFNNVFSGGISEVVDSVGSAIDNLVTSDEEREKLKNELVKIQEDSKLKSKALENEYEKEITKRNASDQEHGNFLTKSIRPIFLVWVASIITVMIFGGMFGAVVPAAYTDLVTALAVTAVSFFFGSKGIEAYKHGKIL